MLGATSAIAIAVMRQLVTPSAHFFLVARSKEKLTAVAQDLLVRGAGRVDMLVADLDDTQQHAQMLNVATSQLGAIDLALLAHGVLGDQNAAEQDYFVAESALVTNFLSPVSLLTWLANYCVSQNRGTIAVISSVAGDRGRKSNYVYGASKAGLDAFLSGLRNRCDRAGVQVLTIKPGFVATPMTADIPKKSPLRQYGASSDGHPESYSQTEGCGLCAMVLAADHGDHPGHAGAHFQEPGHIENQDCSVVQPMRRRCASHLRRRDST